MNVFKFNLCYDKKLYINIFIIIKYFERIKIVYTNGIDNISIYK